MIQKHNHSHMDYKTGGIVQTFLSLENCVIQKMQVFLSLTWVELCLTVLLQDKEETEA